MAPHVRVGQDGQPVGYACSVTASGVVRHGDAGSENRPLLKRRVGCTSIIEERRLPRQAFPGDSGWLLAMTDVFTDSKKPFCRAQVMERLDGAGVGDTAALLRAQLSNDGRPDPYAPFELTKATVPLATHLLVQAYAETLRQKALSTSVDF